MIPYPYKIDSTTSDLSNDSTDSTDSSYLFPNGSYDFSCESTGTSGYSGYILTYLDLYYKLVKNNIYKKRFVKFSSRNIFSKRKMDFRIRNAL